MNRRVGKDRSLQVRGVAFAMVAVSLTMLFAFAAIAVDIGRMYVVRTELQRAADAAALAAADQLSKAALDVALPAARTVALDLVTRNLVENKFLAEFDPNGVDLQFGQARLNDLTGKPEFFPDAMPPNAVRVSLHFNVGYTFARLLGRDFGRVNVSAAAATRPRDYMLVIDCSGSMTKQSVESEVAADLAALGIPVDSSGKKKNPAIKTALSLTYQGGDPMFDGVYAIGEKFLPPSVRILPLKPTKEAAAYSISILEQRGFDDLVGAVAYASYVEWVEPLTTDYARVRAKLLGATKYGGTSLHEGIRAAREELLSSRARPMADKVIVLMTDGKSDYNMAIQEAQLAADAGMYIHCVGLGMDVDYLLLEDIAALGRGITLYVDNTTDPAVYGPALEQVFVSVATNTVGVGLIE